MKHFNLCTSLALALCVAAGVSCAGEEESGGDGVVEMNFTAGSEGSVRTVLTDGNGVEWQAGDRITVFAPDGSNWVFSTSEDGATVTFSGSAADLPGTYCALYPYNAQAVVSGGTQIVSELESVQQALQGSFAPGCNLSVAVADADRHLMFRNTCALLKFTLELPSGTEVTRAVIRSNAGEPLAGAFVADASSEDPSAAAVPQGGTDYVSLEGPFVTSGTYYMAVLPGELSEGFTLYLYDSNLNVWSRRAGKNMTLGRSVIFNLGVITPGTFLPEGGYEVVDGVYHIYNEAGLRAWGSSGDLSSSVVLEADIVMSAEEWTPVGTLENGYAGDFDGNGKVISGLVVNTALANAGFFGGIGAGGKVHGLTFEGAAVSSSSQQSSAGTVAGFSLGVIEGCSVSSSEVSGWYVGAVCGNNSLQVKDCTVSDAKVNSTYHSGAAGGSVGINYGLVDNCTVSGESSILADVDGGKAGGIAGMNSEEAGIATSGRVRHCSVEGALISGTWAGGIVGENSFGVLSQCVAEGVTVTHSTTSPSARLGGIVGYNTRGDVVASCAVSSVIGGESLTSEALGGITGYNNNTKAVVYGCYASGVTLAGAVSGDESGKGALVGYTNGVITSCYAILPDASETVSLVGRIGKGCELANCVGIGGTDYSVLVDSAPDLKANDGTVWKAASIWDRSVTPPAIVRSYDGE